MFGFTIRSTCNLLGDKKIMVKAFKLQSSKQRIHRLVEIKRYKGSFLASNPPEKCEYLRLLYLPCSFFEYQYLKKNGLSGKYILHKSSSVINVLGPPPVASPNLVSYVTQNMLEEVHSGFYIPYYQKEAEKDVKRWIDSLGNLAYSYRNQIKEWMNFDGSLYDFRGVLKVSIIYLPIWIVKLVSMKGTRYLVFDRKGEEYHSMAKKLNNWEYFSVPLEYDTRKIENRKDERSRKDTVNETDDFGIHDACSRLENAIQKIVSINPRNLTLIATRFQKEIQGLSLKKIKEETSIVYEELKIIKERKNRLKKIINIRQKEGEKLKSQLHVNKKQLEEIISRDPANIQVQLQVLDKKLGKMCVSKLESMKVSGRLATLFIRQLISKNKLEDFNMKIERLRNEFDEICMLNYISYLKILILGKRKLQLSSNFKTNDKFKFEERMKLLIKELESTFSKKRQQ